MIRGKYDKFIVLSEKPATTHRERKGNWWFRTGGFTEYNTTVASCANQLSKNIGLHDMIHSEGVKNGSPKGKAPPPKAPPPGFLQPFPWKSETKEGASVLIASRHSLVKFLGDAACAEVQRQRTSRASVSTTQRPVNARYPPRARKLKQAEQLDEKRPRPMRVMEDHCGKILLYALGLSFFTFSCTTVCEGNGGFSRCVGELALSDLTTNDIQDVSNLATGRGRHDHLKCELISLQLEHFRQQTPYDVWFSGFRCVANVSSNDAGLLVMTDFTTHHTRCTTFSQQALFTHKRNEIPLGVTEAADEANRDLEHLTDCVEEQLSRNPKEIILLENPDGQMKVCFTTPSPCPPALSNQTKPGMLMLTESSCYHRALGRQVRGNSFVSDSVHVRWRF